MTTKNTTTFRGLLSAALFLVCGVCIAAPATGAGARHQLAVNKDASVTITAPDGGKAVFAPEFTVLFSEKNPNLTTRWGKYADKGLSSGDTGSSYHVFTWGKAVKAAKSAGHVADGYDPESDRAYGADRTPNLFDAADVTRVRAASARMENGRVVWTFPDNAGFSIEASVEAPADGTAPLLRMSARTKQAGWWSFGYTGAPECKPSELTELWQPLVYTNRRFPEGPYIEAAFRSPLATTLVENAGVTVGVMADPSEYPFEPLPTLQNSRFGVLLRNQAGLAQPMLFAPILGGAGSQMKSGATFAFTDRLIVSGKKLADTIEEQARAIYGFADVRHNILGSLNTTFENMVAFGMSEYARFNKELRGFAYDTDVPGSVKNVSALHPLSVALVTDSREIYEGLVYPQVEYFVSRERFLFSIHPAAKGQGVSKKLGGLGAPLNEYAALYAMTGRRTPFLIETAEQLYPKTRSLNLDAPLRGDFWSNSLSLYRATGDEKYLARAKRDADDYIRKRVFTQAVDFEDTDARGMFFWTSYAPQWVELYELYEVTGEKRYLEAARIGARTYTQFTQMAPRIPDGSITVNKDGLAPAYRTDAKKYPRIRLAPETVPAWQVAENGLTPESSVTSRGHRGILLACFAPWMLRVAEQTGDAFLHDVARSAIIGRYTSFPGYHINTARTTAYQKPDFSERPGNELNSATSIHYNHIWPHIALVLDYLVSDVFAKSHGNVDFPGRYAEGYAYLQQKIYGDRPGKIFTEKDFYLWMPRGVVTVTDPELNYVTARAGKAFAIILTNQSKAPVTSQVIINDALVGLPQNRKDVTVEYYDAGGQKFAGAALSSGGGIEVKVAPESLTAVVFRGVEPKVGFQREMVGGGGPKLPAGGSVCDLPFRGARAVGLLLGPREPARVYAYIPDDDREIASCTVFHRQGGGAYESVADDSFPFEYTLPTKNFDALEFYFEVKLKNGKTEKSPVGKVLLK